MGLTPDDAKRTGITPPEIPNFVQPSRNVLKQTTGTTGGIESDEFVESPKPASKSTVESYESTIGKVFKLSKGAVNFLAQATKKRFPDA